MTTGKISSDAEAIIRKLDELAEDLDALLGETQLATSYLNELLDLRFPRSEREGWLQTNPDEEKFREELAPAEEEDAFV
jgi:hypothetical protein